MSREEVRKLKDTITVVVPCYNEQEVLPLFYKEMCSVMADMADMVDMTVLFVDDGSRDDTLSVIQDIGRKDTRFQYLSFSRNFGKEAAIYAGLQHSVGAYVTIMDADLQDPPRLLVDMYTDIKDGLYDSIAVRRVSRKGEPPIRSFFARQFYKLMSRISKTEIMDGARDYRLMSRKFVNAVLSLCEYNRFSKGIFGWVGFKTKWYEYENVERAAGETKWSFWKLFSYSIEGIVAFSVSPLMLSSVVGVMSCFVSFLFLVFLVIRRLLFGDPVAGWASTVSIILFISGIQLLCIGILGQYLAKTYLETKNRPIYIIDCQSENTDKP